MDVGSNRRFAHDRLNLRAGGRLGRRAVRTSRSGRWPSFKRVVRIAGLMAQTPDQSLPKQCETWADLKAAYRFLHHENVTPDLIQQTHRRWVRDACAKHPVVLVVEDTSELDYTSQTTAAGLGPIGNGLGRGLLQHSALAVLPNGQLLGVLHQTWTIRKPKPEHETPSQRHLREKESDVWPQTVEAIPSPGPATRMVHVCDRGGDLFDMMVRCRQHGAGFLIRSQKDRRIEGHTDKLWAFIARQADAGHRDILVPARDGRPPRVARLSIRLGRVSLDSPQGDPRFTAPLQVGVVQAVETHPPEGIESLNWILLTSEAADTFAQACQRVDWYARRWLIEEWHKVEKTGCRLEESQIKDAHALACLAAFVAINAVRILQMRDLVQDLVDQDDDDPAKPANQPAALAALAPPMWRRLVARKAQCPMEQLTPRQFWLTIAQKGGWLGRKSDGLPGWQTLWRGWHEFLLMVIGAELYQSTLNTCG